MSVQQLPMPDHYDPDLVVDADRWVRYHELQAAAIEWRQQHGLRPASTDQLKLGVLFIDNQNTFCHPEGELFVAGRSGTGAVDDTRRAVEFVYKNLGIITGLHFTLDTHRAYAVFHPSFLINDEGRHPEPFTLVTLKDVLDGTWKASPFMASALKVKLMAAQKQLEHYVRELEKAGRYDLTIWPFHGMIGGKGHTLASGFEEAGFFHAVARGAQTGFEVKGTNPWVENYSILGPEVKELFDGTPVPRNTNFLEQLLNYDVLAIAGQAKSHCVAWTIEDLLGDIQQRDEKLASKVYLLEDCTSPVVVPGALDYTDEADAAFDRFRAAGMNVARSTDPIDTWPGVSL